MKAVHLKPLSTFKNPFPQSDTLFGAICWGIKFVHGNEELEKILEQFKNGRPPFKISSIFPKKNGVYYVPKPITSYFTDETVKDFKDMWIIKKAKKIQWITVQDFDKVIKGEKKIDEILKKSENVSFVKDMIQPGNSINRLSSSTEGNLFFRSLYKHDNTDLYFLLNASNKKIEKKVLDSIRFIRDRGLGGGSSTGHGDFEFSGVEEFERLAPPKSAEQFITLSLYMPKEDEWNFYSENSRKMSYELVKRKGIVEEAFTSFENPWKRTVFMFKPGSIFPTIEGNENYGQNPIVNSEDFDVQQYGYAFDIGADIR